jgi:hypothetical protein
MRRARAYESRDKPAEALADLDAVLSMGVPAADPTVVQVLSALRA